MDSVYPLDPAVDLVWAQEAEARIQAFESGRIGATDAHEVFAEMDRE